MLVVCVKRYALVFILLLSAYPAFATSVDISTNKYTYNYGDHLTVTIRVSETSYGFAAMYIIGPDNNKSSPIPVQITGETTTITTPNSFVPSIFEEGTYSIEVEYSGIISKTEFELVDSGSVFLPFGSNAVISQWVRGSLSDHSLLKFLSDNNIVSLSEDLSQTTSIPQWYKISAAWWLEQKVTDSDFINGLQYMIDKKAVR